MVQFIAEIGLNHNGSWDLACEMIRQAQLVGADIVKFQLGWKNNITEINYIDDKTLSLLIKTAQEYNIEIMFSVFSPESYERLKRKGFAKFKIPSRLTKNNPQFVKKIIGDEKAPDDVFYISFGMGGQECYPELKLNLEIEIDKKPTVYNIYRIWCMSKYPVKIGDFKDFPFSFITYDGYSDHCIGIDTCLLAIARGAQVIEKHFTMNKYDISHHDHLLSAEPAEFRQLVELGRNINYKIERGI